MSEMRRAVVFAHKLNPSLGPVSESFQFRMFFVTRYSDTQQHAGVHWHYDAKDHSAAVLTLRQDSMGVCFEALLGSEIRRIPLGKGSLVLLSPEILHAVTPVNPGERHVAVGWYRREAAPLVVVHPSD